MPRRSTLTLIALSLLLFVVIDLIADAAARMAVGGQGLRTAVGEHLHYAAVQPLGTAVLASPFLALAWLAAPVARRRGSAVGLALVCGTALLLGGIDYTGYAAAQDALAQHHWTAATFSVAFLPFESAPVLALGLALRWLALRSPPSH